MCFRSLLLNLRQLTLNNVAVSLPALQPVATRLRGLEVSHSRLQGRSDGFLNRGWTALTTLGLYHCHMENATLTAALGLPALEDLDLVGFSHQAGVLQLDQLTGSCPNIRRLRLQLSGMARDEEGRWPCCSLLSLGRLADLYLCVEDAPLHASLDLDLPGSLTRITANGDINGGVAVDFFWALREAAKCIRRGAQLRRLSCGRADAYLQPAQWGGMVEQFRQLGGQLSSLRELHVTGGTQWLLRALGAVASSAPRLTCLQFSFTETLPRMELPPISSASLESVTVTVFKPSDEAPAPPLVLTFLPGCTRLQEVLVRIPKAYTVEGTAAKIRCHCSSPTCIVPLDVHPGTAENIGWEGDCSHLSIVGVQFLPGPPSPQDVPGHTVLHACHAAGPQQPLKWGHLVMHGFL